MLPSIVRRRPVRILPPLKLAEMPPIRVAVIAEPKSADLPLRNQTVPPTKQASQGDGGEIFDSNPPN